jgi:bifunctional non-homologous end joining protein LigD
MATKTADPLARYNAKRDFTRTAEPAGTIAKGAGHTFMVQKHDATRLHWDLRLEMDGVLKSWAVTRGPSLDPEDKRLAVRTEDHPLSYATFEGTIPKGEYGGGTVMLWDRGTWAPVKGKSAKDLEKGHLHFILDGEPLVVGNEARPARHCPGFEHAVHLQPQIPVQPRRVVLLDHETMAGPLRDRAGRLRGLGEIALGIVAGERVGHLNPPLACRGDRGKRGGGDRNEAEG